jgi:hypothetical protein
LKNWGNRIQLAQHIQGFVVGKHHGPLGRQEGLTDFVVNQPAHPMFNDCGCKFNESC